MISLGEFIVWIVVGLLGGSLAGLIMLANSRGLPGRKTGAGRGHEAEYVEQSVPR